MGIRTTCIGVWPKPAYVKLPDRGLGLLGRDLAKRKLRNPCLAAGQVRGGT